ncbi:low-density lipoprotein receptor-related protein [Elysia marginata]|uniref:Low-density lipoprotein receptor-related protein n=1 Tax=Elysia marginata TaxID=1093978 RepID=A0AAV4GDK2_9GAST|nr:low-density lipoprotein receptor-related protein [Elysia marginata]
MRSRTPPSGSNDNHSGADPGGNDLGEAVDDVTSSLLSAPAASTPATTRSGTDDDGTSTAASDPATSANDNKMDGSASGSGSSGQGSKGDAAGSPTYSNSTTQDHPEMIQEYGDQNPDHLDQPEEKTPVSVVAGEGVAAPSSPGQARYTVTPKDVVVTVSPSGGQMLSQVVSSDSNNISNNNNEYKGGRAGQDRDGDDKVATSKPVCAFLGNKKLLVLILLLIVLVMVVAAGLVVFHFEGKKSSSSLPGQTAVLGNETWRLRGGPGSLTDPSTLSKLSVSASSLPLPSLTTTAVKATTTTTTVKATTTTTPQTTVVLTTRESTTPILTLPFSYCDADHFACSMWGECLSLRFVCDGYPDCSNGRDERVGCADKKKWRRCANNILIEAAQFCDGVDHCGDNSDEDNCSVCPTGQVPCSKAGGRCIPATWRCDGHRDCSNGEDEQHCANCTASQFVCADYSCIEASARCDGKVDCGQHGGDEENCLSLSADGHLLAVSTSATSPGPGKSSDVESRVPVCAVGWTSTLADHACALMGVTSFHSWKAVRSDTVKTALAVVEEPQPSAPFLSNLKTV